MAKDESEEEEREHARQPRREEKSGITKFLSGGGLNAIIIFLVGQATFSIVYQIINNEQQQASILANQVQIKSLRDEIYNMQTPLSQMVLKLDGRIQAQELEHKRLDGVINSSINALHARIDSLDRTGTRGLEVATNALNRLLTSQDRSSDRIATLDKRIGDVENRAVTQLQGQLDLIRENIKRIDDQLTRTVQALDATYNALQDHLRYHPPRGGKSSEVPSHPVPMPTPDARRVDTTSARAH